MATEHLHQIVGFRLVVRAVVELRELLEERLVVQTLDRSSKGQVGRGDSPCFALWQFVGEDVAP